MLICDHCRRDFPEAEAVYDEAGGQRRVFCCRGCNGIYRFICGEGLAAFYRRRDWSGGARPSENPDDVMDLSHFAGQVTSLDGLSEIELYIKGMRCASCVWLTEQILRRLDGVSEATVSYVTHRARIRWDPGRTELAQILAQIRQTGYAPVPGSSSDPSQQRKEETRDLLFRFGTAGFLSLQLMMLSAALYAGYFQGIEARARFAFEIIALVISLPVIFYSGLPFFITAGKGLVRFRFTMESLIAAGSGSAFLYSLYALFTGGEVYFDTATMIITMFLLGRLIEAGARGKAARTMEKLAALRPRQARVVDKAGAKRSVPIESVARGDLVEVFARERIPLDGIVRSGGSEVDESLITGEAKPVMKRAGSPVIGGSTNLYGSMVFEVTRTGDESVLAGIIRGVEQAEAGRPKIQTAADRIVGVFAPIIGLLAVAAVGFCLLRGLPVEKAVMTGISILVIACPCSLGLATPLALMIFTTLASEKGILIRRAYLVETAGQTTHVVFDKTGTITVGRPALSEMILLDPGLAPERVEQLAAAVEKHSEHGIGRAIAALHPSQPAAMDNDGSFTSIPGRGVIGRVQGLAVIIGNRDLMREQGIPAADIDAAEARAKPYERAGDTVVYLGWEGALRALMVMSDRIREEASSVVQELKDMGCRVTLMSGDQAETTRAVAALAGIDHVLSRISPEEKHRRIADLQSRGEKVLMVGDGINDAAALIEARTGIAMGRGTEIAVESADAVLIRDDLSLIPDVMRLAGLTLRIIRQNIFWAFFYNAVALPLAFAGFLHPILAASAMAVSSLFVVGNSLRIRRAQTTARRRVPAPIIPGPHLLRYISSKIHGKADDRNNNRINIPAPGDDVV